MPSASLTGNWRALTNWSKQLDRIASNRFAGDFANKLADTLLDLVDDGFKTASDPDDHPWKPKAIPDGRAPLHGSTGGLSQKRNWLKKQVDSKRIRIGPKPDIAARAAFAQFGTGLYGPKGRAFSILPKNRKALTFLTRGGIRITRASALNPGSPIRRILPSQGKLPYKWFRALTHAKNAFLAENMRKVG